MSESLFPSLRQKVPGVRKLEALAENVWQKDTLDDLEARAILAYIGELEAALRLMLQYGVDEDDQVWIAPNPAGVGRAATALGIDALFVRQAKRA